MNRWLGIAVVILLVAGCGELTVENQPSTDNTVSPPSAGEQLQLISAVQLADKRWEYHLALDLSAISGDKTSPFYMADFSDWIVVNGANNNGRLEFKIQTYDRLCSLAYGGNYNLQSWAYLDDSQYFVQSQDALEFGLQNGCLVKWNDFSISQYGATATDNANVVGFTLAGDQLIIWFNLAHVSGSLANPFWFGDQTGYAKQPIAIQNSSGWAEKTITIADGQVIKFTFGGDIAVNTTWAYIRDSQFYKFADDFIVVGRYDNTIVAR
jgi:hypothetical protein